MARCVLRAILDIRGLAPDFWTRGSSGVEATIETVSPHEIGPWTLRLRAFGVLSFDGSRPSQLGEVRLLFLLS